MKFIAISIAALSSTVLAAPLSLLSSLPINDVPAVGPVVKEVEGLAGPVTAGLTKKDIISTVTGTVDTIPVVNKLTGEVAQVAGSVTSGKGLKERSTISTITTSITSLKSSITSDLMSISTALEKDISVAVVPQLKSSITSITQAIGATMKTMVPAVQGTTVTLASGEVKDLISSLGDVETIVSSIKSTITTLVSTLESDAMTMVKPEVSSLLAVIMPLVSPVTDFASSVGKTMTGTDGDLAKLTSAVSGVKAVAQGLLTPVTETLATVI